MKRKGLGNHFVIGMALGLGLGLLSMAGIGKSMDLFFYDLFHGPLFEKLLPKNRPPEEILIVALDQTSLAEINRQTPLPRSLHARLIQNLAQGGAKVIAFDFIFDLPTAAKEDEALAQAVRHAGNVVLGASIEADRTKWHEARTMARPLDTFLENAAFGIVSVALDPDNVVRRYYDLLPGENGFAAEAARLFLGKKTEPPPGAYIPFLGPPNTFSTISYYQALDPAKYLTKDFFQGKLVLVGLSLKTPAGKDMPVDTFRTPYLRTWEKDYMSGVELHANMIAGILGQNWITLPKDEFVWGLILVCALCGSFLHYPWRPRAGAGLALAAGFGYFILAFISLRFAALKIPVIQPLLALELPYALFGIRAYLQSEIKRREIRNAFSKYLSPAILEVVLADPKALELGGRKCLATVFFSDLAGFTSISEKLTPEEVAAFLNRYFDVMTEIIFRHNGTVDKFIGDAIMAFWGAPVADPDHALNACRAALEMQARMASLREDMQREGMPALSMRIGLNTGEVIVGNMGSSRLFNYSVLGDTVNLASRLEGANKEFGSAILVSKAVQEHAGSRIVVKPLGAIRVKGKAEETEVFELTGIT